MLDSIAAMSWRRHQSVLKKRPGITRKYERARNRSSVLFLLLLSNRRAIESAREPARQGLNRTVSPCRGGRRTLTNHQAGVRIEIPRTARARGYRIVRNRITSCCGGRSVGQY